MPRSQRRYRPRHTHDRGKGEKGASTRKPSGSSGETVVQERTAVVVGAFVVPDMLVRAETGPGAAKAGEVAATGVRETGATKACKET